MIPRKITNNSCIYVIMDPKVDKIDKVGSAGNGRERRDKYLEKGLDPSRFVVVIDFDKTNREVNDKPAESDTSKDGERSSMV